jgi:hypothetical protein
MSAESVYEALLDTIADQSSLDDGLSMFELIGAVRLIEAGLLAEALEGDEDEDEDEDAEEVEAE